MSQDIFQFINGTVKNDLPNLAKTKPYLGAGIIAGGIEFLGACLDAHPLNYEGVSAARFCQALNELFNSKYHQFSRVAPYTKNQAPRHDLYTSLRCGMAHVLRPQGILLTTQREALEDGNTHLSILNLGGHDMPLIVIDEFISDYEAAVLNLENKLNSGPLPSKLQGHFLRVWNF